MRGLGRVRLLLGVVGVLVAQTPYWLVATEATVFVVVFAVLALVPYPVYVLTVNTRSASIAGGVALLVLPVAAYGDLFFDSEPGATLAPATVPIANVFVLAAVLGVDALLRHRQGCNAKESAST